jgi:DNA-binding transcriptional ArsR family regulator
MDPDIAAIAGLLGDSSRVRLIDALADGSARPAGELARVAGISPQTASTHLDRLLQGGLLAREVQGRHHYYRLRGAHVAQMLETLASVAPRLRS